MKFRLGLTVLTIGSIFLAAGCVGTKSAWPRNNSQSLPPPWIGINDDIEYFAPPDFTPSRKAADRADEPSSAA